MPRQDNNQLLLGLMAALLMDFGTVVTAACPDQCSGSSGTATSDSESSGTATSGSESSGTATSGSESSGTATSGSESSSSSATSSQSPATLADSWFSSLSSLVQFSSIQCLSSIQWHCQWGSAFHDSACGFITATGAEEAGAATAASTTYNACVDRSDTNRLADPGSPAQDARTVAQNCDAMLGCAYSDNACIHDDTDQPLFDALMGCRASGLDNADACNAVDYCQWQCQWLDCAADDCPENKKLCGYDVTQMCASFRDDLIRNGMEIAEQCPSPSPSPAPPRVCSIQSMFSGLSAIKQDPDCRQGCDHNSGDCAQDWTPGSADECSAACGRVFEPFWDTCGDLLQSANMGGIDDMGVFYDKCLEQLYPPGICGTYCNAHTFDCYLAEVQEACCDEGGRNCVSGEDVPETCPVGCAIVFPSFLETCTDYLQETGAPTEHFEAFEQECLDLDGMQLVEYAITLRQSGCIVELDGVGSNGRRRELLLQRLRRLQGYVAPHMSNDEGSCPWDVVDDLAKEVDGVCCGADGSNCAEGADEPSSCSVACAVSMHQFTTECAETMAVFLTPEDPFRHILEHFEGQCMTEAEGTDQLLHAIMGAVCPEDVGSGGAPSDSFTLAVAPAFVATLGEGAGEFDDCFLSPEEIATNYVIGALAQAIKESASETPGIPTEDVTLLGISTDGNDEPGCAHGRRLQSGDAVELRFMLDIARRSCEAFDEALSSADGLATLSQGLITAVNTFGADVGFTSAVVLSTVDEVVASFDEAGNGH